MKKIFLIVFVLSLSLGLFAQTITNPVISIRNNVNETSVAINGCTIQIRASFTASETSLATGGLSLGTDYRDTVQILWYSGVDGTGTLINTTDVTVSNFGGIVNGDQVFENAIFTLPVPPDGSNSFMIAAYIYSNQVFGGYNQSTGVYSSTASGYYQYMTAITDSVTEAPTLTTPASSAVIGNSFNVSFIIPEAANAGSVKLSFIRTSGESDTSTHIFTYDDETSGTKNLSSIDASNISNHADLTLDSGGSYSLTSGSIYEVKIEYQDEAENDVASDSNTNIMFAEDYIQITGNDYNVGAGFLPSSTNNPYFQMYLVKHGTGGSAAVSGFEFDSTGNFDASDIVNIKLWSSPSATFSTGTATYKGVDNVGFDPVYFTGFSEDVSVGATGIYIYLTIDVSADADGTDHIGAGVIANSDITSSTPIIGAPLNGGDHALPVTLTSFQAIQEDGVAVLNWVTAFESNNSHWNIYRAPSSNFGQAAQLNAENIPAAGSSTEPVYYNYTDSDDLQYNVNYWYWLECVANNGLSELKEPSNLMLLMDEDNNNLPEIPTEFGLFQNSPNPFNPETMISFALEEDSRVELNIFNVKGQLVKNLYDGNVSGNQLHKFWWDGKDTHGNTTSSGVYLYTLKTSNNNYYKRMLLTK